MGKNGGRRGEIWPALAAAFCLLASCQQKQISNKSPAERSDDRPSGKEREGDTRGLGSMVYKVAFGSCASERHPLPIFHEVVRHQPDLFVFLGDNIYGDTRDMKVLRKKYQQLGNKASYQALKKSVEILATWDDHDYGQNDAGKNYPMKEESKQAFLEFFEEDKDSDRFRHEGIYTSVYRQIQRGAESKTVQVILLDGRTFRDDLRRYQASQHSRKPFYHWDYSPHVDTSTTLLGEQQWKWLEGELAKPADFRVLATGTQFGIEANGYEAWANFPHEQDRLARLLAKTQANHLVVISGDVHYAEVSKWKSPHGYPIYDVTASGLSKEWKFATPNKNRIEGPVMDNHFGMLSIDFSAEPARVKAEVWDVRGNQRIEYTIPLRELEFPNPE